MPQFLVAVQHPDNYVPSLEDKAMMEEIHALNREMIAAVKCARSSLALLPGNGRTTKA
jgi:hypothetical protein